MTCRFADTLALRRGFGWLLAISLHCPCSTSLATSAPQTTGDVLEILIPATGRGATYLYADPQGRWQWLYSGATTLGAVEILKPLTEKIRPNGTTTASFPSGHTASAFWGAAFLNTRYGPWWGVPAYGLAALTGYSRLRTDADFADDVLAGASIALLSNLYCKRTFADRSRRPYA